jgi:5-methylcytosine-specific restriction endonuclease McrA
MSIKFPYTRKTMRHPPMPIVPSFGECQWCGKSLTFPNGHKKAGQINPRRRWCSVKTSTCVSEYLIASFQGDMRKALKKRDKGRCAVCNTFNYAWDADHKIPLWSIQDSPTLLENRSAYWGLQNLQTLCGTCHKDKCKEEAAQRAAIRKSSK